MIRDMATLTGKSDSGKGSLGSRASEPRAHVSPLRGVPAVLEQFGVPSEPILAAVGLQRADLDDPDHTASVAEFDQLLGLCVARTRCPHFGLLIGRHVDLQCFGIAGRLARNAPTVGAALKDLAAYFLLHDGFGAPNVALHDGRATFTYGVHAAGLHNADQIYDFALVAMLNGMRQLCGADWRPDLVMLPRKRPADLRPYREVLGAALRFDSAQAALHFPGDWLGRPVADADALLHTLLQDRASIEMSRQGPALHVEVRRILRAMLLDGECSRAAAARRLGLHPRTFGRRLQQGGTTFQALLEETRSQMALQLLHDTRLTVSRVAASLGYRDPTVFTRAFRRWTGQTPRQFRAALPGLTGRRR